MIHPYSNLVLNVQIIMIAIVKNVSHLMGQKYGKRQLENVAKKESAFALGVIKILGEEL